MGGARDRKNDFSVEQIKPRNNNPKFLFYIAAKNGHSRVPNMNIESNSSLRRAFISLQRQLEESGRQFNNHNKIRWKLVNMSYGELKPCSGRVGHRIFFFCIRNKIILFDYTFKTKDLSQKDYSKFEKRKKEFYDGIKGKI